MDDLPKLLRPKHYKDIVGQQKIVSWLMNDGLRRPPRPVLFTGQSGTGKSTIREVYEQSLLCLHPTTEGEFCGRCAACSAYRNKENPDFHHHRSGERSKVEEVRWALEFLCHAPLVSSRKVLVCEEAGVLSRRSAKTFLELTEDMPDWAALIIVTNQPENLPKELRDRLTELETKPIGVVEAVDFLAASCERIGLGYDRAALALIHGESGGSIRKMLRHLEALQCEGAAHDREVRCVLRLNGLSSLENYVCALSEGDLERQEAIIESWADSPARKLELIHRAAVDCYFAFQLGSKAGDGAMAPVTAKIGATLHNVVKARAAETKQRSIDLWSAIIAAAEPKKDLYPAQLRMRIAAIDDLLRRPTLPVTPITTVRAHVPRRIKLPRDNSSYLNWRQFCATWDAASFLTLQYGLLFNLRISISHIGANPADHKLGASLVSELTRQLDMRLKDWTGGGTALNHPLHWMYHHEGTDKNELVTRLVVSVPSPFLADALRWLSKFFGKARWRDTVHNYQVSFRRHDDIRFHWASVLSLCRTLNPGIRTRASSGVEESVIDQIGLNSRIRASVGKVLCSQIRGNSGTLGSGAQRRANKELPLISALRDRAWNCLVSGWELSEFSDRTDEIARRHEMRQAILARFPGGDPISGLRRSQELEALERQLRAGSTWLRSWRPWWMKE